MIKNHFLWKGLNHTGAHSPSNYDYNENLLDSLLSFKFNEIYNNITYVSPIKYLPKIGFQYIDVYEKKKNIGDPGGFCSLWAIWYEICG